MGAVNLVVFRNFDEATWVNFKLFGMLGLDARLHRGAGLLDRIADEHRMTQPAG